VGLPQLAQSVEKSKDTSGNSEYSSNVTERLSPSYIFHAFSFSSLNSGEKGVGARGMKPLPLVVVALA